MHFHRVSEPSIPLAPYKLTSAGRDVTAGTSEIRPVVTLKRSQTFNGGGGLSSKPAPVHYAGHYSRTFKAKGRVGTGTTPLFRSKDMFEIISPTPQGIECSRVRLKPTYTCHCC